MTPHERRWKKEVKRRKIHQAIARNGPREAKHIRLNQNNVIPVKMKKFTVTPAAVIEKPIIEEKPKKGILGGLFGE